MNAFLLAVSNGDLGHSHSPIDALPHLAGMLMVLIALGCLWCLTAIVAKLVALVQASTSSGQTVARPSTESVAAIDESPSAAPQIAPEIVAVIAAAIAATRPGAHRILTIKPADLNWEKAGRQSVLSSHQVRLHR
ncbi:MAG: OadG family transporter subunit [Luteolibacter sp.]